MCTQSIFRDAPIVSNKFAFSQIPAVATFLYFLAWFFYVPMATVEVVEDKNRNISNKVLLADEEGVATGEAAL